MRRCRREMVLARCAVVLCVLAGRPVGAAAAVLTVNDTTDPGTVGDGALSLSEAIRLATGDLASGALSGAEQAQIAGGTPGAASADTIAFSAGLTAMLHGSGTAEVLPPLSSGNDTIDGGDTTVLDGVTVDPAPILWGLRVTSSGNVVRGLTFRDVPGSALMIQAPAGMSVSGNQVLGNRFTRSGIDAIRVVAASLPSAGATVTGGTVDATVIQGNTIETGTSGNLVRGFGAGAMNLMSAYAATTGSVTGATISNTTIRDNIIRDVFEGVFARAAVGFGTFSGNALTGLTVRGNTFERVNDQTLYVSPATISGSGSGTDDTVTNLLITGNIFRTRVLDPSAPYLGGGPFVSGGFLDNCAVKTGTPSSVRDRMTGVEISDNTITDRAPYGLYVQAAQSCGGAGGNLIESGLRDVTITGNTIDGCDTGVSLAGGASFRTGRQLSNARNELANVTIANNTITGNAIVGVELIGGVSGGAGADRGGNASNNAITTVTIRDNTLADNETGVAVTGGVLAGGSDTVRGNTIGGLAVTGNQITGSTLTGILLNGVTATGGSTAMNNTIDASEIVGNTVQATRGVGIAVQSGSIAAGAAAQGNTISRPHIAQNQVLDTTAHPGGSPPGFGISLQGLAGNPITAARIEGNTIVRVANVGIRLYQTAGHTVRCNQVSEFGRKPFRGNKRQNKVTGNSFGRRGACP